MNNGPMPELPATLPRKGNQGPRSRYSPKVAHEILRRYADGEPIEAIAHSIGTSPERIMYWRETMPAFATAFSRARTLAASAQVYLATRISEDRTRDLIEHGEGRYTPNSAAVARDKLRVEHRMKLAGFLDPRAWGEKTMLTGADGASSPFAAGGEYDMARLSADEAATLATLIAKMRKVAGENSEDAEPVTIDGE